MSHFKAFRNSIHAKSKSHDCLITEIKGKKIKITSENKHLPVQIDGDLSGVLPAEISVSKHSFEMMLPSKTVKRLMASQKKIVL